MVSSSSSESGSNHYREEEVEDIPLFNLHNRDINQSIKQFEHAESGKLT